MAKIRRTVYLNPLVDKYVETVATENAMTGSDTINFMLADYQRLKEKENQLEEIGFLLQKILRAMRNTESNTEIALDLWNTWAMLQPNQINDVISRSQHHKSGLIAHAEKLEEQRVEKERVKQFHKLV
ncbi:hypothetical protein [Listeria booriae]|uniref:hypothetical protein n=1 Tax=Listeria booriae TaxID=1552123 RepID=UPI00162AD21A|nr:hypothetical protein [Listeria booriae]MBC1235485.1 hypothetical protein [Listeria booriae]MBC1248197.1 hypothetical protein [Listeria booriae]MBC1274317.1 hypothetical protein [Listeria booriae]